MKILAENAEQFTTIENSYKAILESFSKIVWQNHLPDRTRCFKNQVDYIAKVNHRIEIHLIDTQFNDLLVPANPVNIRLVNTELNKGTGTMEFYYEKHTSGIDFIVFYHRLNPTNISFL